MTILGAPKPGLGWVACWAPGLQIMICGPRDELFTEGDEPPKITKITDSKILEFVHTEGIDRKQ